MLPQIKFFNFEVAPVLDLQVTPTSEDCIVEMLSCKFEGSDVMERQNEHFSAFMRNHIKWETVDARPYLAFDVKLNLALEIIAGSLRNRYMCSLHRAQLFYHESLIWFFYILILIMIIWCRYVHNHSQCCQYQQLKVLEIYTYKTNCI
ncbi:uncharacterized protein [Primulina huaijiensis]|uniref:uncharacterized protein isoform X1 n=1 Tax=Primulina huaijiensis TaxID=1492673 RepID=UPI003CC77674